MKEIFTSETFQMLSDRIDTFMEEHDVYDYDNVTIIIEKVAERIDEDYGGDYDPGERFLNNLECGDGDRLQALLDEAFGKWVDERNINAHVSRLKTLNELIC